MATNRELPRTPIPVDGWPLWMTTETAARYLDFGHAKNPRKCFAEFARKKQLVARGRRGDRPLYHRRDLDQAVTVIEGNHKGGM